MYKDIATRIMVSGVDEEIRVVLESVPEEALLDIHMIFVQHIKGRGHMTPLLSKRIRSYMKALTRRHIGLFWKIFNKYCKKLSEVWYRGSRDNLELVLYSLVGSPGTYSHAARCANLDAVLECAV